MHEQAVRVDQSVWPETETGGESAFCITIYNEELIRLQRTLSSILTSLSQSGLQTGAVDRKVFLCLIIDGLDAADPNLLAWLRRCGLLKERIAAQRATYETFRSTARIADLIPHLESWNGRHAEVEITFVVCLKPCNRGKLDSHAIFFRELCDLLRPEFCIQVDVGTVIAPDAYAALIAEMGKDCRIGAIAPCITTTPPDDQSLFISTWQHVDFVVQKSMFWPFEVASGHLSVIPGQFCMLRRTALVPCASSGADLAEMSGSSPIDAYFRGLDTEDPLEKIMFLAEDRVIGSEIVLRENSSWRLEYCPEARAVTDACLTLPELMRQRRRWSNSALACRVWLIAQLVRYLTRRDRTLGEKVRFVAAMLGQIMLMIREFASPAITLSSMVAFVTIGHHLASVGGPGLGYPLYASLAGIVAACVIPKYVRGLRVSKAMAIARGWLGFVLAGALTATLAMATSGTALLLVLLPGGMSLLAMVLVFRRKVGGILMMLGVYIIVDAVMTPVVSAYSIFRLHDVSWGTKGLLSSFHSRKLEKQMRTLRVVGVVAWTIVNGSLILAALAMTGITSHLLNPVFELVCLINIFVGATVLYRLARQAFASSSAMTARMSSARDQIHGVDFEELSSLSAEAKTEPAVSS